mgnify:CR=1 FL=1
MTYKLLAGAPFDVGNLFFVPAFDAGYIVNPYPSSVIVGVDGGNFIGQPPSQHMVDGGSIPLAGTASYDPSKTYGPDDIVSLPG